MDEAKLNKELQVLENLIANKACSEGECANAKNQLATLKKQYTDKVNSNVKSEVDLNLQTIVNKTKLF